ncbi:hypothetical protein G3A43_08480 [Paraburkholderia aspalathi]|nr:hypothetical protein [Paraburkholderia aspalathi]MBK3780292.1 hypothetical protein [Paraburkholderia aspalathi]
MQTADVRDFFYRIEGFDLSPGWKTAGFTLIVSTEALVRLKAVEVSVEELQTLTTNGLERIARANILPKKMVQRGRIALFEQSACPLMFTTDPTLGGSIGARPDELRKLVDDDALVALGTTVEYTAHNCDAPGQSIALMILAQTWAEWAYTKLLIQDSNAGLFS